MDILSRLASENEWKKYFAYKLEKGSISKKDAEDLKRFIDDGEYLKIADKILNGEEFEPPKKTMINKSKAGRKRIVYTFKREENYCLKLITFMLREYDHIFAPNLYSFRKEKGVKCAVNDILKIKNLDNCFVYKVDISDYFNSVDAEILLPKLKIILKNDAPLYDFFEKLLSCPYAVFDGETVMERKGIMAGVPISTFLANVYLMELDFFFYENNIPYMRYSDDIIIFASGREEMEASIEKVKETLALKKLVVNAEKEIITLPDEEWTFLGFSYKNGIIDIAPMSFIKLKAKMRRKMRALERWADKKSVSPERAARAFVKRFNAKLYDNPIYSELTWTRWFFPVINTDCTLKKIDEYMQECIRRLATGTRTKAKYNFKYEDIKALGYRSLVNEYYKSKKQG